MISRSVARSGKCASNVSPKIGNLVRSFEETIFRGEQGRSRIAFGAGLSWTEIPLFEQDRASA
jgi:hypothetical protein